MTIDGLIARLTVYADSDGKVIFPTFHRLCADAAAALRAQRDEIARLTAAQSESCTDAKEEAMGCYRAVKAERERDAAMKDAERYRWLRACRAGDWDALNNLRLAQSMCGLDTAIDAAIAKGKG